MMDLSQISDKDKEIEALQRQLKMSTADKAAQVARPACETMSWPQRCAGAG